MSNAQEKFGALLMEGCKMKERHVLFAFPDFRRLFLARLISSVGDKYFSIALAWWVISQEGENQKFFLGALMAVNVLPVVLFGPLWGTLVDRLNKKLCMVAADLARATLVGVLCILLFTNNLSTPILLILCFFTGALSPLFDAAASVSLVKLTSEESLSRAVATDSLVIEISGILGALLGSALLAFTGVIGAFAFNALSFLVSLFFVFRIQSTLPNEGVVGHYWRELVDGFLFIKGERKLRLLLAAFGCVTFFASPLLLFIPLLVKDVLQAGVEWVAFLQLAFAAGSALIVLLFSFKPSFSRVYETIIGAVLIMGICLGLLSASSWKPIAVLAIFVSGSMVGCVNALAISLFQEYVAYEYKGRFFAILNTVCFSLMPLAFFVNGALAESFSLSRIIFANAVGTSLLAVGMAFLPRIQNEVGVVATRSDS